MNADLGHRLRLITILDVGSAGGRDIVSLGEELLTAGAPTLQLRAKGASAARVYELARPLAAIARAQDALFFVNDRADVALASGAHGVHIGPDDLPLSAVRQAVPASFLVGASADDPDEARRLVGDGASYVGCGTVYETTSKKDAGNVIGVAGLARVVAAVEIPVVGIGGVTLDRVDDVMASGCAGIAVIGAVMSAASATRAVRELLDRMDGAP
jgi:thiamine-phosphate pyrophosphorylase